MTRYKEELDLLVEWLHNYTNNSLTGFGAKRVIGTLATFTKRNPSSTDLTKRMDYMEKVDTILYKLFSEDRNYKRMFRPTVPMSEAERAEVYELTEILRFADIRKSGYLPIFEKYDAPNYRKEFEQRTKKSQEVLAFHRSLEVFTEAVDTLDSADVTNSVLDLYIKLRDLEGNKPALVNARSYFLSDMYQKRELSIEMSGAYLRRLAIFRGVLSKVVDEYGIKHVELPELPDDDVETYILEDALQKYRYALREVFVLMQYARILRVV